MKQQKIVIISSSELVAYQISEPPGVEPHKKKIHGISSYFTSKSWLNISFPSPAPSFFYNPPNKNRTEW